MRKNPNTISRSGQIRCPIADKPSHSLGLWHVTMKNRVWISVYAGSRRFSPKFRLKKSVANAVFGFRHFSPLYDRVQKGWGYRGTSRLEGIETVG